jgi:O-antigen/teichoic acid export membrane protein
LLHPDAKPPIAAQLGTQALIAFGGSLFTLAVGLPLQVYVARVLGAEGLGQFGLLEGIVNTASGLLSFGVASTALRFIPAHLEKSEYGDVRRLLRFAVFLLLSVGVAAYPAMLLVFPLAERVWPELHGHAAELALISLMLPLGMLLFLLQQALRGFQDIRSIVLGGSILQLSVKALATIAAFAAGLTLSGYIMATLLSTCFAAGWMAYALWRRVRALPPSPVRYEAGFAKVWIRYATIMYLGSLLGAVTGYLDRFLLGTFIGVGSIGVLLIIRQLQQLPQVFNQLLLAVGAPMFAAAHSRDDATGRDHLYVLGTDWMMKLSLPLLVFLFAFGGPVLRLFGPQFEEQGVLALWIVLAGQTINLAFGPIGNLAIMSGLETSMLRLSVYNAILGVALMVGLTPLFGLVGVAVATAAQSIFINIAVMWLLRTSLRLRWWNQRYIGWLAPTFASIIVAGVVFYSGAAYGAMLLGATLVAVYLSFGTVVLLQGLNEDERDLLIYLKKRLTGRVIGA